MILGIETSCDETAAALVTGDGEIRANVVSSQADLHSRYADAWHLMNIAVDPAARRRGIATALLTELLERAGREGQYTLEVRLSNQPAIALYERFGFQSAGLRRGYYHDNKEDALIMWRTVAADRAELDETAGARA